MKAIIMAAGKGSRMEPLTCTRPKSMVQVTNKPFLMNMLDELESLVDEAVVIIHKYDKITPELGKAYKSLTLSYMVQEAQLGTGHALLCAMDAVKSRFLLLNGDCIVPKADLALVSSVEIGLLAREEKDLSPFGAVISDGRYLSEIREKSVSGPGNSNAGVYVLDPDIFSYVPPLSPRKEYELTDMLNAYARQKKLEVLHAKEKHHSITYPWDLLALNQYILDKVPHSQIDGIVKPPIAMEGIIVVGKGTIIDTFATLKGPCIIGENCRLGPHTYIRPYTAIGNNCHINCEVKNSIIYDNVNSVHSSSHILDSIVGKSTNIGAGTITANLRHDGRNVLSEINFRLIDTGLRKLGAIIGDNVHTGIGTAIRPGRKLWPNTTTLEHEVVKKDKHQYDD